MHIVVLTGSFYPDLMAPSACVKPYLQELAKENEVEVVCPTSDNRFKEDMVLGNIKINFVSNCFNTINSKATTKIKTRKNNLFAQLSLLLIRAINYFKEYALPCPYDSSLEKSYLQELNNINKKNKIDVIISVTFPFYTHVFALKYKIINKSVKWITYTTDPLAYNEANPIPVWKKKKAIKIEKEVYDNCDYCLITEELWDNLISDYQVPKSKVVILPYLIELNSGTSNYKNIHTNRPQALYAGCLFYRVRNPKIMLDVFSRLKEFDLRLYVTGDRTCRSLLKGSFPSNIYINNIVPRNEYLQLLTESDVLINLSNNAKLQAPHKLLELISTGRPIVNFYYHKNSGYRLIERYPLGVNVDNNLPIESMTAIIKEFIDNHARACVSFDEVSSLFPEHILVNQMLILKRIITC